MQRGKKNRRDKMKTYYNVDNISYYDEKAGKWLHGHDAIKHMKCIRSGDSNWDLYLDEKAAGYTM